MFQNGDMAMTNVMVLLHGIVLESMALTLSSNYMAALIAFIVVQLSRAVRPDS